MTIQDGISNLTLKDVASNHLLFSSLFLKIRDKQRQLVPFYLNPVQLRLLQEMTPRTLVLKGRQQGVSTLIQSLLYRLAITRSINGGVLSYDDKSTQAFRRMFTRFHENMPEQYRPVQKFNNRSIISFEGTDSELTVATAGGSNSVGRGFSFTHLHISEYAFIPDPVPLLAGIMQSGNPKIILESTPNGTENDFYDKCIQAYEEPESTVWRLCFYQWWLSPDYAIPLEYPDEIILDNEEGTLLETNKLTPEQIKWRRSKIKELGRRLFDQEYPESVETAFIASGVGYFTSIENLNQQFHKSGQEEPVEGHLYVAGLDLGRAKDYTALSIIDATTNEEVALLRVNKLPWDTIFNMIIQHLIAWNVSYLWIENNNVGQVAIEQLVSLIEQNPACNSVIYPINTNKNTKPLLVNRFYTALEDKEFDLKLLPNAQATKELRAFQAVQTSSGHWQYKAASGGHDDTVMARLICWHGVLLSQVNHLEFI